jgi:hypothetical protein
MSIGILGVGLWVRFSTNYDGVIFGFNFSTVLIVLGSVPAFVALIGILAMVIGSTCLIYLYALLMLLVVTAGEIALGIFALVERGKMRDQLIGVYNGLPPEARGRINDIYQCKDAQSCANVMSPTFEHYCLIAGIIAFCLAGLSLTISALAFSVARHGPSRISKAEGPSSRIKDQQL